MNDSSRSTGGAKTILFVSPYWKEEHRWMVSSVNLANLWQRLGFRIVVACMGTPEGAEPVSPFLVIHRRKDVFLPDPWNYGIAPGFSRFVRSLVHREHPEIVVVNKILFWTSLSLLGLRLRGVRVLLLTDTLVGMTWWPRGFLPRIGAFLYAWTLGWLLLLSATKVVFYHPQPPKLLKRLGIARRSSVIPPGIDCAAYPPHRRQPEPGTALKLTYVGRLESVKGVEDFLEAAVPLRTKHPGLTVNVVGWHRPGHPLVERFSPVVSFTGLRSDIPEILAGTDIFVLPSFSEGLSNALMEAMASGCACVATDTGGNRTLIQNGISGFLYPPGDRESLRAHLERLIADPHKRIALGEAARRRIETEYSWDVTGPKFLALFEHLQR